MARLLPLFPLQIVALPGSPIPLHIFEERYREMVGQAAADGSEFGIVLAKDDGIVNTGCTVVVERVLNRYPDGRFDVLTRGRRRFEITALDQEKAYLRGEVEYFDDDDRAAAEPGLRTQAFDSFTKMVVALNEGDARSAATLPDPAHPLFSFQLAHEVEDLDFKLMQQQARSERERLRQFIRFVEAYIPRREYAVRMKRAVPNNGFGHKPIVN